MTDLHLPCLYRLHDEVAASRAFLRALRPSLGLHSRASLDACAKALAAFTEQAVTQPAGPGRGMAATPGMVGVREAGPLQQGVGRSAGQLVKGPKASASPAR